MLGQCVQVFGACDGVSLATYVPSPRTFNGIFVASASLGAGVFKAAMNGMSSCVGVPFTTADARLEWWISGARGRIGGIAMMRCAGTRERSFKRYVSTCLKGYTETRIQYYLYQVTDNACFAPLRKACP